MRSGSCASEEGRVKRGELTEATWARNIFAESTTVFIRACSSRERGRERGRDKAHINKACIFYIYINNYMHMYMYVQSCSLYMTKKARQRYTCIYTPRTAFSFFKDRPALEPTTLCILGEH